MNPLELLEHNRTAYEAVMKHYVSGHRKACVVHATGTGKSYIIAAVTAHFGRTLVVTPNNYVIAQVKSVVKDADVDYTTYHQLMMDAENKNRAFTEYDLFVFDEFHRTGAERWAEGVQYILKLNPEACVFGTTATPVRYLDNGRNMADELFEGQVMSTLTVQDAWVRGILVPPVYVMAIEDFSKVYKENLQKINSAYIPDEERPELIRQLESAQQAWDMAGGVPGIIRDNLSPDTRRVIVFCPKIEKIEEDRAAILGWFLQAGLKVHDIYTIDSSRSEKTNMDEMERFQQDDYEGVKIMISVNMLNEGIHIPRVDALVMLRRTISMNVYLQQMGRCMTATGGGTGRPVILDLQNNLVNVGLHNSFSHMTEAYQQSVVRLGYTGEDRNITVKGLPMDIVDAISCIDEKFNRYCINYDWNNNYALAKAFFDTHGHFPKRGEDVKLNRWAYKWWTTNYLKNPEFYQQKADMLTAIGFDYQTWDRTVDVMWQKNFDECEAYFKEHGHFPTNKDNPRLNSWARAWWRRNYLDQPAEYKQKADMLIAIGFNDMGVWGKRYQEARAFFDTHGHFPLHKENASVNNWARQWWTETYLKNPQLHQQKADLLTSIGFSMACRDNAEVIWSRNYDMCRDYFNLHGRFPQKTKELKLYRWATNWWRATYLKNPRLHQDKADKLTSIGFAYRTAEQQNDEKWMANFSAAKAFFDEHDRFPKDKDNKRLNLWAYKWWNNIYLKNPAEHQQKAEMLLSIGFDFKSMKIVALPEKHFGNQEEQQNRGFKR